MKVITIDRQFGSAGQDVAMLVAKTLGFKYYDNEIVDEALKRCNVNPEIAKTIDEKATNSLLYSIVTGEGIGVSSSIRGYNMPLNDKFFISESEVIKEFAKADNCVILGRCADYILENEEDTDLLSVFVYAKKDWRIARVARELNIPEKKAKDQVARTDKQRKNYYEYYSGNTWGSAINYDLCINTERVSIERAAHIITSLF